MKTPLMILLVAILVQVASGFPFERAGTNRERYASWDDVNVVAHGLLQLGHGLKDHVDKYKDQMRDITAKLKALNSTLTELAKNIEGQGETPRTAARETEGRDRRAENSSSETRMEQLRKKQQEISARMERLEEKVEGALRRPGLDDHSGNNDSYHGDVSVIQRILEFQTKRMDELVEKIRQQQDKLEKQTIHLQALQGKVSQRKGKSLVRHRGKETALKGSPKHRNAPTGVASDCHELFLKGERDSGVYTIQPHNSQPFDVLCEMTSDGGWTVIQKRQDGSQNFNQLWEAYQKGFGSLNGEFWMGLENIHSLSQQGQKTLMVEFSDWRGEMQSVQYQFRLDGEENNYALHLQQGPTGGQEKALYTGASGLPFSTPDRDNDQRSDINCAKHLSGGWWFSDCGRANLNGRYPRKTLQRQRPRKQLAFWSAMTSHHNLLKTTMKIKS